MEWTEQKSHYICTKINQKNGEQDQGAARDIAKTKHLSIKPDAGRGLVYY